MGSEEGPALAMGFLFGLFVAAMIFIGWRDYDARRRCEATPCAVGKPMLGDGLRCLCATEATRDE